MKVLFNYNGQYKIKNSSAVALGTFDGIHIGHQELIMLLEKQKAKGYNTVIYTFINHPMTVLQAEKAPLQLMTVKEKIKELSKYKIDFLILNPFNDELKIKSRDQFLLELIDNLNAKSIITGFNHRFGSKGLGDTDYLRTRSKEQGFELMTVEPVKLGENIVSSTLIRDLVASGKVREAATMLGRPYKLTGKVVKGFGLGRKLGFPTANMRYPKNKQIPGLGIYAVECKLSNRTYMGVTSIGYNPTFDRKEISIETYIMDFNEDIYGKDLSVSFIEKIRDEIKFASKEELSEQINKDVFTARKLIYKIR
ncbi:MAG: bifunctional riboflavin kinase/FAD synthetase [Clostridiales bacterium]|nr:bifunctional riboflavin kinase/FAD synthetase [Clostridiales bacterium]